ncbi:protein of unknown function [Zobellia uliginosa]|uniref:DUF4350 domain-containing protein n=1 Tax=Zobellia uliginosa TaxID=143224 RepID=A0ABY1L4C0_9FLAO|nr:DUF4350 domain-containing protein [Zobellia uliginosa]SIS98806.1 protein of unknown function [Zobellia uliginosa]
MDKKGLKYIIVAVGTLVLLMLFQYNRPKEINWGDSYVAKHKIPYGTYVLNDVMQGLFQDRTQQVNLSPFEFLSMNKKTSGTYFFVNNSINFGDTELFALLDWTTQGNTLFIASENFEKTLLDTLKLNTASLFNGFENIRSYRHKLVNPTLKPENAYTFKKDDYATYFDAYKNEITTVLGTVSNENNTETPGFANVIKIAYGKGEIVLSTFPKAFTNYFILKNDNKQYTAGLLSYLDDTRTIYIDNYHKAGKAVYTSPMHVFLNTKEFKWAYYLVLIGVVMYVFFEGKRKQRAIPIVTPLKNQTLAFTRTIADMYFEKGEGKQIAQHKIVHFLEYLRSHFYLNTTERTDDFFKNLASRSHHTQEQIASLFSLIDQVETKANLTDTELQQLNTAIEKFKNKAHGRNARS